jgi:hypothetical protein
MRESVPKRNGLGEGGNRAKKAQKDFRSFITCPLGQPRRPHHAALSDGSALVLCQLAGF